jgi:hypothetical protein
MFNTGLESVSSFGHENLSCSGLLLARINTEHSKSLPELLCYYFRISTIGFERISSIRVNVCNYVSIQKYARGYEIS